MRISDWSSDVCPSDLYRRLLAAQRRAIGVIGRLKPRDVGDILPQRQLAVHREVRERLILVELVGKRRPRFLELLEIRRSPPVAQRTGRIERRDRKSTRLNSSH